MAKKTGIVLSKAEHFKAKKNLKARSKQLKRGRISPEALPKLERIAELEMARSNARFGVG